MSKGVGSEKLGHKNAIKHEKMGAYRFCPKHQAPPPPWPPFDFQLLCVTVELMLGWAGSRQVDWWLLVWGVDKTSFQNKKHLNSC